MTRDPADQLDAQRKRAVVATRGAIAAVAVAVVFLLAATATTVIAIRADQQDNDRVITLIEDCINPGGDCYERSQAQDAAQVRQLRAATVRVNVAVAFCQDRHPAAGVSTLTACARGLLAGRRGH